MDIDPEYAPTYSGKLCAELRVRKEELLGEECGKPISEFSNYQKAVRFADAGLQKKLKVYDEKIKERIPQYAVYEDIFQAAREGTVGAVRYFLEKTASGVHAEDKDGDTPLHKATSTL